MQLFDNDINTGSYEYEKAINELENKRGRYEHDTKRADYVSPFERKEDNTTPSPE